MFQFDPYLAGLHKSGSNAVERYKSNPTIVERAAIMNAAFKQLPYKVDPSTFEVIEE